MLRRRLNHLVINDEIDDDRVFVFPDGGDGIPIDFAGGPVVGQDEIADG